jgi:hypothetical protein
VFIGWTIKLDLFWRVRAKDSATGWRRLLSGSLLSQSLAFIGIYVMACTPLDSRSVRMASEGINQGRWYVVAFVQRCWRPLSIQLQQDVLAKSNAFACSVADRNEIRILFVEGNAVLETPWFRQLVQSWSSYVAYERKAMWGVYLPQRCWRRALTY